MKITKISINNFRLLKEITIDLEEDLSLILGKNNCGKTSLLLVLDKFLRSNHFSFDDFNADFKEKLKTQIEGGPIDESAEFPFLGISLKLFIEYNKNDDLSNIGNKVIMDLDPSNNVVVLGFEYYLSRDKFDDLINAYNATNQKRESRSQETKDVFTFLKENYSKYFQTAKKSILFDMTKQKEIDETYTDLIKEKILIDNIINFKCIQAKREVSNKDRESTLSLQSAKIYKKLEEKDNSADFIEEFKDRLMNTDKELDKIYSKIFEEVIEDIKQFGGIKQDESIIKIISSLQHKELLKENTTVVYTAENCGHNLPENYNGLGYLNLISMIFEIKILLHEFQREDDVKPADINLFFIEEPEVHTHPQMQCIFIKNIKSLLQKGIERDDGQKRNLQTILSTHSSHIVSESNFDDIKYFKKVNGSIVSKNLKDLEKEYSENPSYYKFLKQYLTLHRAELFFADKAIFIEGDTERILLPAMMKKMDQDDCIQHLAAGTRPSLPLLSQNISIIEVGAYSKVFEKFIDFIGIKSLIVTDIDTVDKSDEKCPVSEGTKTSNASLKFFYGESTSLDNFKTFSIEQRLLKKNPETKNWENSPDGTLLCIYQINEKNDENEEYHARSFEDAFFHVNKKFILSKTINKNDEFIGKITFPSLTQHKMKEFVKSVSGPFEMANGVNGKPSFAMEVLLNSAQEEIEIHNPVDDKKIKVTFEYSNWGIPAYIKEGLKWLKKD